VFQAMRPSTKTITPAVTEMTFAGENTRRHHGVSAEFTRTPVVGCARCNPSLRNGYRPYDEQASGEWMP